MARKEVEAYFHARNIDFVRTCCVSPTVRKHSLDDLVKIGKEPAPWFCRENNAYLAFLNLLTRDNTERVLDSNDADTLKAVSVYHRLDGCP